MAILDVANLFFRKTQHYLNFRENRTCRVLSRNYIINGGFKRIYFYHIRKTGGTSLNHMFLSLGGEKGAEVYEKMTNTPNLRIISNNKIFAGWNKNIIEEGNYFYAFSHIPAHQLKLPLNTFTLTCIRDPINRVLSHYKMLLEFKMKGIAHPCMKIEGKWLGNNFSEFLSNIPNEYLLNQLYMFSKTFSQEEALDKITNCSHWFITENFAQGVEELSLKLQIQLKAIHARKTSINIVIKQEDLDILRDHLEPEIVLYTQLKKI